MLKRLKPKIRNYVSDIDRFIHEYDQAHPEKSASQQREIAKHQRIEQLRDKPQQVAATAAPVWQDFTAKD